MLENKMQRVLLFICISVFIFSTSTLGWQYVRSLREKNVLIQLAQTKQSTEGSASFSIDTSPPQLSVEASASAILAQYETLSRQNSDMIGWIKIDGTEIDYPVMYTGDDFYLGHDFDKAAAKNGLPYIDRRCTVEPYGTNTIIYAHNMKNGTMFSELLNYKSPDYYAEHAIIRFDTLHEKQEYKIIAAFESEVYKKNDTVFKHYNFLNAESKAAFDEYVTNVQALSLYDTGINPEYGDAFITLMTCSYHTDNGRFVVVAKKVN